jgi:hypothetical protein
MYITIDIQNNPEYLQLIHDTIPYMNDWKIVKNSNKGNDGWNKYPNKTARYFTLNASVKTLSWVIEDEKAVFIDTSSFIPIRNMAHLSDLLEKINELTNYKLPR